jgi:Bacterial protein of unknown function (DUF899)
MSTGAFRNVRGRKSVHEEGTCGLSNEVAGFTKRGLSIARDRLATGDRQSRSSLAELGLESVNARDAHACAVIDYVGLASTRGSRRSTSSCPILSSSSSIASTVESGASTLRLVTLTFARWNRISPGSAKSMGLGASREPLDAIPSSLQSGPMAFETIQGTLRQTRLTNESAEYRARREELRLAEIDLMQRRERVAELRRRLPPGATVQDYIFQEGPADLNAGDSSA